MTPEALRLADELEELKIRQQLRGVLFDAYKLLTDPEAEAEDADSLIALIVQTLKDTTP